MFFRPLRARCKAALTMAGCLLTGAVLGQEIRVDSASAVAPPQHRPVAPPQSSPSPQIDVRQWVDIGVQVWQESLRKPRPEWRPAYSPVGGANLPQTLGTRQPVPKNTLPKVVPRNQLPSSEVRKNQVFGIAFDESPSDLERPSFLLNTDEEIDLHLKLLAAQKKASEEREASSQAAATSPRSVEVDRNSASDTQSTDNPPQDPDAQDAPQPDPRNEADSPRQPPDKRPSSDQPDLKAGAPYADGTPLGEEATSASSDSDQPPRDKSPFDPSEYLEDRYTGNGPTSGPKWPLPQIGNDQALPVPYRYHNREQLLDGSYVESSGGSGARNQRDWYFYGNLERQRTINDRGLEQSEVRGAAAGVGANVNFGGGKDRSTEQNNLTKNVAPIVNDLREGIQNAADLFDSSKQQASQDVQPPANSQDADPKKSGGATDTIINPQNKPTRGSTQIEGRDWGDRQMQPHVQGAVDALEDGIRHLDKNTKGLQEFWRRLEDARKSPEDANPAPAPRGTDRPQESPPEPFNPHKSKQYNDQWRQSGMSAFEKQYGTRPNDPQAAKKWDSRLGWERWNWIEERYRFNSDHSESAIRN